MKLVPIDSVRPSTYNPRTADPARIDLIELSLRKLGFLLPIFAGKDGEIISGHQRHHVSKRMGLEMVPVEYCDVTDLPTRKAINILFNRGTNDLAISDTPETLTAALALAKVDEAAAALPDKLPHEMYPCMSAKPRSVRELAAVNAGRWVKYATSTAKAIRTRAGDMPIVIEASGRVVNGIGRLRAAAEDDEAMIPTVEVTADEAKLSHAMLNLLSMDFDIHTRYADVLRYNSFRRARGKREYLGRAFTFPLLGKKPSNTFDINKPSDKARWTEKFGRVVLDFGAGLMCESKMLNKAGIKCVPFEPFTLTPGTQKINPEMARGIAREFLSEVARGTTFESIFLSAILNSVPFIADRQHIVRLVSEIAYPSGKVFACSSSIHQTGYDTVSGMEYVNKSDASRLQFLLNYEPRITVADITSLPKVQKYHTVAEFRSLWLQGFQTVIGSESINNCEAQASHPRQMAWSDIEAAIRFEFDLPYPDGSRMGLADEAIQAFSERRKMLGRALT